MVTVTRSRTRLVERLALRIPLATPKWHSSLLLRAAALLAADWFAFGLAGWVAISAGAAFANNPVSPTLGADETLLLHMLPLFAGLTGYLAICGRYSERIPFWSDMRVVVSASLLLASVLATLAPLADASHGAVPLIAVMVAFPFVATAVNYLVKGTLVHFGLWTMPVVIVGDRVAGSELANSLTSDKSLGYRVVETVDPLSAIEDLATSSLRALLIRTGAQCLLIAPDANGGPQRHIIQTALRERVPFALVTHHASNPAFSAVARRFLSHDTVLMSFQGGLSQPFPRAIKAATDIALALIILLLVSPALLLVALAVRMDGGPVLYRHKRVGTGGRPFYCLKFRSMRTDGDAILTAALERDPRLAAEWRETAKLRSDPRITRVGQFLRKTSLDELPQLFNVIRLEMSLVGPRPIVESEIVFYGDDIASYYVARPGLTGLWQVSGRSSTSYEKRVKLDVWYVNNWTIWHDFAVLLKTIPAVLARDGAW